MGWVLSFTLRSLYHWETSSFYPTNQRLGASQNRPGLVQQDINLLPLSGIKPRFIRKSNPQSSHCTNWAIQDLQNAGIAWKEGEKQQRESVMISGAAISIRTRTIENNILSLTAIQSWSVRRLNYRSIQKLTLHTNDSVQYRRWKCNDSMKSIIH